MSFCPNCGKQLLEGANFCMNCGLQLNGLFNQDSTECQKVYYNPNNIVNDPNVLDSIYKSENGDQIKMIKKLRELSGMDLKNAKETVEKYLETKNVTICARCNRLLRIETKQNKTIGYCDTCKTAIYLENKPKENSTIQKQNQKTSNNKKRKKSFGCGTWVLIIFFVFIVFSCSDNSEDSYNSLDNSNDSVQQEVIGENNSDKNEKENFRLAIESVGMDYSNVKNIDNLENWSSGPRYSFVYDGFRYILYELDNGEISSISTELKRTKIYERGYEPLNYKDFEPDKAVLRDIETDSLYQMTNYIDGATSFDTVMGSMMYDRIYDDYFISGQVKAKNNTNKEVFTFSANYTVTDNSFELVYLAIDGKVVYGSEYEEPEIIKTEKTEKNSGDSNGSFIVLSDGKEGKYGKYDLFDGEPYLRYYVPTGEYTVKCNISGGFYIESIELHKEDGYDTSDVIEQFNISKGEELKIRIEEGQCITLYVNTEIELYK